MAERDAAVTIPEPDCTPQRLYDEVRALLREPERRERMTKNLREMVRLDSTERIGDIIESLIRK